MRIVAVADTHLFHEELVVPDGDLFVHAGDMCRGGDLDELRGAVAWIASLPHRHKLIVAGNHDWAFAREPELARALLGDIAYLEDSATTIEGFTIYGAPWQPAYNDWAFNLPRGAPLAEKWSSIPRGLDLLVTHSPPMGIGDNMPELPNRLGCAVLRARVEAVEPRLHMFGHIHCDGGAWQRGATMFANVTTWECERAPTVIDLSDSVELVSVPPRGR
jgi:Calcineurin-like phosphoesterase